MLLKDLENKKIINVPSWLVSNTQFLCYFGSLAYGTSTDFSDVDIYGWCIPPKRYIFPNVDGYINGFDKNIPTFNQWQQHHIKYNNKEYDCAVFNIVQYFRLAADCNPNIIDSLFVNRNLIFHITQMAERVREKRKIFLHKGIYHKLKGYAFSQLKLLNRKAEGKRKELVDKYGWDVKSGSHVVRLILQCEQVLNEGDLDLQRNKEQLKSIRRGEWSKQDLLDFFQHKEKTLEKLYSESKLRHSPDEESIKQLLLECLEIHYGSIDNCIKNLDKYETAIRQIQDIVGKL